MRPRIGWSMNAQFIRPRVLADLAKGVGMATKAASKRSTTVRRAWRERRPSSRPRRVTRRTISLPASVDALIEQLAEEGESYSAAVARLVETAARALRQERRPKYIASDEGPEDLGRRADEYLRRLVASR